MSWCVMKNIYFLFSVVTAVLILIGLRYELHIINDSGFLIVSILLLISVLYLRSVLKVSFSK